MVHLYWTLIQARQPAEVNALQTVQGGESAFQTATGNKRPSGTIYQREKGFIKVVRRSVQMR